jgi:hypothetical protein
MVDDRPQQHEQEDDEETERDQDAHVHLDVATARERLPRHRLSLPKLQPAVSRIAAGRNVARIGQ